jgi:hypothetical protein
MSSPSNAVPTNVPAVVVDTPNGASGNSDRCNVRGCRVKGADKLVCAAKGCEKKVHLMCYQGLILRTKTGSLEPLPNNVVVCTKGCYQATVKAMSGAEPGRGKWNSDGKNGVDDPNTSMQILLDWMTTEGNYSKYCGKDNNGIRKQHFATILAAKMTKETDSERNAKQVQEKIRQLEESFRNAHDFATSETGAGIQNEQGEESFKDLVKKRCPYYYELCDIMADPHVLDTFSDDDYDGAEDI